MQKHQHGEFDAEFLERVEAWLSGVLKGRPAKAAAAEDKPKNHVRALPDRKALEIQFPMVEGYAFALKKNLIRCDVDSMERLVIEAKQRANCYVHFPHRWL